MFLLFLPSPWSSSSCFFYNRESIVKCVIKLIRIIRFYDLRASLTIYRPRSMRLFPGYDSQAHSSSCSTIGPDLQKRTTQRLGVLVHWLIVAKEVQMVFIFCICGIEGTYSSFYCFSLIFDDEMVTISSSARFFGFLRLRFYPSSPLQRQLVSWSVGDKPENRRTFMGLWRKSRRRRRMMIVTEHVNLAGIEISLSLFGPS